MASAFRPARSISLTTDAAASAPFVYVIATFAPSAARRLAIAAPMPREPPVMSAAFPSKFFVIVVLLYAQSRRTLKHMLIRHEPNVVARQASPHHVRLRQWVVVTKLKHTLLSWEECFTSMGVEMELRHLRYFVAVA